MECSSKDMLRELHKLTRRLSEVIEHDCLSLSNEQIHWQPNTDVWSIGHCLHHLNMVSAYYYPNIEAGIRESKTKGLKSKKKFKSGWLGQRLVDLVQLDDYHKPRRSIRTPSTFSPIDIPPKERSAQALVGNYLKNQRHLMHLLEQAHEVNLKKIRVPIAILKFIKIRLGDCLRFVCYHNERHIVQALRIRYHTHFPSNRKH